MGHVENGLTTLLGFAAAMTALSCISSLVDRQSSGFGKTLLVTICAAPFVFVVLVALLAFAGGLGLAGWSVFTYLKYGYWPWPNGFAVLRTLDVAEVPYSGWIGFDNIVTAVLSLPAAPTILVGSVASVAALVVLLRLAFVLIGAARAGLSS